MSEETVTAPAEAESAPAEAKARGLRKTRVGVVISDKMEKTIVVEVERGVPHPKFKKIVKQSTKLYAHDEDSEARVGDKVSIVETRPVSKSKRWRLEKVLAH